METEKISKVNEMFDEVRDFENLEPNHAVKILGDLVRKSAREDLDETEVRASMQLGYILAKSVQEWTERDEMEKVKVPSEVYSAVQKKVEDGSETPYISVTEAMDQIAKRLSPEKAEAVEKVATEKADDSQVEKQDTNVSWEPDLADGSPDESVYWGEDPPGLRA